MCFHGKVSSLILYSLNVFRCTIVLDLNFESSEKVGSVRSPTAITGFDTSLPYDQKDTWTDFDLPNPIYMIFSSFS